MEDRPRVALFIDAENVAPTYINETLEHAKGLGRLTIARCYGNDEALRGWREAMGRNHLKPMQTLVATGKQNASDFALTVDAVSLLHRGLYDVAFVVSSDADFATLAMHLREHARGVYAIGDAKKLKHNYRALFDHVFEFLPKQKSHSMSEQAPAKPAPVSAKAEIPAAELVRLFKEYNRGTRKVTVASFGRFAGNHLPAGYRKGYGNVKDYLNASGAFEIGKDNAIKLKDG
jgi:NYN domain